MIDNTREDAYKPLKRLIPIPDWKKRYDWPKESTIRYWIFHADENGFNKAIVRVGRRILIDEEAFFQWIQNNQGK